MVTIRNKRIALNAAAQALRDQADRDYICARHLYSLGFADQFMWQAQQALEKYLKAMILFGITLPLEVGIRIPKLRGKKGYGHNLPRLLSDAMKIEPWYPKVPSSVCVFVEHVYRMGLNRYSDQHVYRIGDELPRLDEAVWHIRRWCRYSSRKPIKRISSHVTPERWVQLEREYILRMTPGRRQHSGGLLESIIAKPSGGLWREARNALLKWNRWFYDKRRSGVTPSRWSSSSVPVWDRDWARDPEIANLLTYIGIGPPMQ